MQVEATVPNHDKALTPGMFAKVSVDVGSQAEQLTLPQAAIVYNPYGDTVYVVQPAKGKDDKGKPKPPTVQQAFVTTGDTRGDQVAILKGISGGHRSGDQRPDQAQERRADQRSTTACSRPTARTPRRRSIEPGHEIH